MTIKKGDFIELDYTATLMEDNAIFDTTQPEDAERAGMICNHDHDHNQHGHQHLTKDDFKPIIICVGEGHVLPGLDEQLEGLTIGEHDIILGEENAFGKKDPKLLKLMTMNAFKKQKINPFPGLTVDMDGQRGVVRSVSGGRIIVDFNHPLSGKAVKYSLSIKKKIDDKKEQIKSIMNLIRLPHESITIANDEATIKIPMELPEHMFEGIKKDIERLTKTKITFDIKKTEKDEKTIKNDEKSLNTTPDKKE
ncbi:MAG: peptidylprolyl isomerase [Candidatus Woesearchaeota archaeon]